MTKICSLNFLIYLLENEPQTYFETMSYMEAFYWKKATNNEIESIMNTHA